MIEWYLERVAGEGTFSLVFEAVKKPKSPPSHPPRVSSQPSRAVDDATTSSTTSVALKVYKEANSPEGARELEWLNEIRRLDPNANQPIIQKRDAFLYEFDVEMQHQCIVFPLSGPNVEDCLYVS